MTKLFNAVLNEVQIPSFLVKSAVNVKLLTFFTGCDQFVFIGEDSFWVNSWTLIKLEEVDGVLALYSHFRTLVSHLEHETM